ncbi:hypothetical protein DPEC_G00198240 [Dallia pectoralis]|uniref:Uncharacterized protein n=1 Tax=Dallia pectoralis TaxID=75939 RepID=A0ACC2G876_DALPE|nr:hypothetical protein DPEC_G00198240 [Dallia pectoralis]
MNYTTAATSSAQSARCASDSGRGKRSCRAKDSDRLSRIQGAPTATGETLKTGPPVLQGTTFTYTPEAFPKQFC